MNDVREITTTGTGAVWGEYSLEKDDLVGEVDISRTPDGGRSVVYKRGETVVVNGTVPADDQRTDEELAKGVVFGKSLERGPFRP